MIPPFCQNCGLQRRAAIGEACPYCRKLYREHAARPAYWLGYPGLLSPNGERRWLYPGDPLQRRRLAAS